jgi:hypothetical protein
MLLLRRSLQGWGAGALGDTFPFAGMGCDGIVAGLLVRLAPTPPDG